MLNDLMRYSICNSGLTFVDIERVELSHWLLFLQ